MLLNELNSIRKGTTTVIVVTNLSAVFPTV